MIELISDAGTHFNPIVFNNIYSYFKYNKIVSESQLWMSI